MRTATEDIREHWAKIRPLLTIRNEREYGLAVERLHSLLDEIGDDEGHPLYELLDTLGTLLHVYEENHVLKPEASGADMLRFFMEEHELAQSDLPELARKESCRRS